jgi:hypothetical protein
VLARRLQDPLQLVVGDRRHHRRHQYPDRYPASASARIARSRPCGAVARGSIRADSRLSRDVTEKWTLTSRRRAMSASSPRSRRISAPLVTRLTGWLQAASTSSTSRVIR